MSTTLAYAPYWKNGVPAYIVVPIVVGVVGGLVAGFKSVRDQQRKVTAPEEACPHEPDNSEA